jgi:hypothetical protein
VKNIGLLFIFCWMALCASGQEKKYFVKKSDNQEMSDYIVLKNDTLFNKNSKGAEPIFFESEQDANDYYNIVFNPSKTKYLTQWKSEVKIFLSKELSNDLKKGFIDYIGTFPELKNLKISLVKKKEDANYFIKGTSNFKSAHDESKYTVEQLKKNIYYNLNYQIQSDGNGIKSCVLTFDPNRIFDEPTFLRRLKVVFFVTLGQFRHRRWIKGNSLTKIGNDSIQGLSDFDKRLLGYHYQHLYSELIDSKRFAKSYNRYEK